GFGRVANGTIDIGAFESRGFSLAVADGNNQQAMINIAFGAPLRVMVRSFFGEPVQGGVVTFTSPGSGASATFSKGTATLDASGQGSVTAIANGTVGSYLVTASAKGARTISFSLTNLPPLPHATAGVAY